MEKIKKSIIKCEDISILLEVKSMLLSRLEIQKLSINNTKWMHPFHRKFEDNSDLVRAKIQNTENLINIVDTRLLTLRK